MGYNIIDRSTLLQYILEQKWAYREKNEYCNGMEDANLVAKLENKAGNLCKDIPRSMIKYINMQTCLCPHCKTRGIIANCSSKHIKENHGIEI